MKKIGDILGGSVWASKDGVILAKGPDATPVAMRMKFGDAATFARLLLEAAEEVTEMQRDKSEETL